MYQLRENLVLDGRNPSDRGLIAAAVYGLKLATMNGRIATQERLESLQRRTNEVRDKVAGTIRLAPNETDMFALAISRQIVLETDDLIHEQSSNPLLAGYRRIAAFSASEQNITRQAEGPLDLLDRTVTT